MASHYLVMSHQELVSLSRSHGIIRERNKDSDMKDWLTMLTGCVYCLKYVLHGPASTAWNICKIEAYFGKKPSICQITLLAVSHATGNYAALDIVIKRECVHNNTTAQTKISNVSVN